MKMEIIQNLADKVDSHNAEIYDAESKTSYKDPSQFLEALVAENILDASTLKGVQSVEFSSGELKARGRKTEECLLDCGAMMTIIPVKRKDYSDSNRQYLMKQHFVYFPRIVGVDKAEIGKDAPKRDIEDSKSPKL